VTAPVAPALGSFFFVVRQLRAALRCSRNGIQKLRSGSQQLRWRLERKTPPMGVHRAGFLGGAPERRGRMIPRIRELGMIFGMVGWKTVLIAPAHLAANQPQLAPPSWGRFFFGGQGERTRLLKPRATWHCLMPSASCVVSARPGHSRLTADI
jgi:hypothetical protein